MTKKEQIMNFIIDHLNENEILDCNVIYLDAMELEGELVHVPGSRSFWMSKEQLLNTIDEKYNDEVIGHGGDDIMIQILDCMITEKQEEEITEE